MTPGPTARRPVPAAPAGAAELFGDGWARARAYAGLLVNEGIDWGLIGPREADRIWARHLLSSAALASLIPVGASVVDVGAGAGLPGIPIELVRSEVRMTLLEPLERRCRFLQLAVSSLDLRAQVVRGRAGVVDAMRVDCVVARAVAPLSRLLPWAQALTAGPDGVLLAVKGDRAAQELDELEETAPTTAELSADIRTVGAEDWRTTVVAVRWAGFRH